ncbi:hypothetical protein Q1695_013372 [Nippostrongylus brasiliensis]|nr:hypothetical protein Q1695_013372 [Nippostrongylus brasiliensis]
MMSSTELVVFVAISLVVTARGETPISILDEVYNDITSETLTGGGIVSNEVPLGFGGPQQLQVTPSLTTLFEGSGDDDGITQKPYFTSLVPITLGSAFTLVNDELLDVVTMNPVDQAPPNPLPDQAVLSGGLVQSSSTPAPPRTTTVDPHTERAISSTPRPDHADFLPPSDDSTDVVRKFFDDEGFATKITTTTTTTKAPAVRIRAKFRPNNKIVDGEVPRFNGFRKQVGKTSRSRLAKKRKELLSKLVLPKSNRRLVSHDVGPPGEEIPKPKGWTIHQVSNKTANMRRRRARKVFDEIHNEIHDEIFAEIFDERSDDTLDDIKRNIDELLLAKRNICTICHYL